jgi:hypothetical protein
MADPTFDWGLFLQAQRQNAQNKQNMYQNIAGLGQNLGQGLSDIGKAMQERKKQAIVNQLVQAVKNSSTPVQGPAGYTPPNQGPGSTAVPAGQMPNMTNKINSSLMQLDPTGESFKNYSQGMRYSQMSNPGSSGKRTVYELPDGTISLSPQEGATPLQVNDASAMQYTGVPKSAKGRNDALASRVEAMNRGIDARQINELAKTTGITPQQRNLLQQNNMRANRAIELAQKPMTWQEFGAVTTDAAAIMQGGSPQVQQLHDMAYPSWKQDIARAQTYMTSTPTANVPPEFKNRIIGMIQGIQKVDNQYLQKNSDFMQKMLAPTIRGGIGQFKTPLSDMTKTITSTGQSSGPTATGPNGEKIKWNGSQWAPQ